MSTIKMVRTIKEIHPDYVALFLEGAFYKAYQKDAYIISALFGYKTKIAGEVTSCGFPKSIIKRVQSKLEDEKINYLLIDPRNQYHVDEKSDNGNLNTYSEKYQKSRDKVSKWNKIRNIEQRLEERIDEKDFKNLIRKLEDVLDEAGEV